MRRFAFIALAAPGLALLLGCPEASTPSGDASSSGASQEPAVAAGGEQGLLYKMGVALADGARPLEFTAEEIPFVVAGAEDALAAKTLAANPEAYRTQIGTLVEARRKVAQEREVAASKEFVELAKKEAGAVATDSGLIYRETQAGSGPKPGPTAQVTVHYTGTLRDGKVFDSSVERGQPATFGLDQVIPCWTEALQKMSAGSKATIVCPASIAYGDAGAGNLIQPGAALRFDVELLEVKATVTPPAAEDPQEVPKPQEPKS